MHAERGPVDEDAILGKACAGSPQLGSSSPQVSDVSAGPAGQWLLTAGALFLHYKRKSPLRSPESQVTACPPPDPGLPCRVFPRACSARALEASERRLCPRRAPVPTFRAFVPPRTRSRRGQKTAQSPELRLHADKGALCLRPPGPVPDALSTKSRFVAQHQLLN
ncbi:hypothetical protein NDU88_008550 [Pleurodeles waltl]|uniref:Uncharacterized protein n=1 Tax=Pleurodeles waltl TaxID=8319 RepID=A0AAV7RY02_PLEWA|nr:hypothetical protein NDU88_008550 [Pleurodeles waltl]